MQKLSDEIFTKFPNFSTSEINTEAELKFRETYNLERFRIAQENVLTKIDETYKEYLIKPENYPNYQDEWKLFWQKRYNFLVSRGHDATGYNYKPDWNQYWMKRAEQLKINVRNRF